MNHQLKAIAQEEGFARAEVVTTDQIVFDASFRKYCEANYCGQYGANYSCPPACGTPEEMKQKILAHKYALVMQTLWEIPDFKDQTAIRNAKGAHNAAEFRVMHRAAELGCMGFLAGASGCALCRPCAMRQGMPCKFPELRTSCMSAYCIYVKALAEQCNMEYDCGTGRVAFFGMFVFD